MAENDPILPYAHAGQRMPWRMTRREKIIVTGFLIGLVIFGGIIHGPTSGQIRLDTGDLRYCWLGIPLEYQRMPEPYRSKLLRIATMSPGVKAEWKTCVTFPLPTSNNMHLADVNMYMSIAGFVDEDPVFARMGMDELVGSLRAASGPLWRAGMSRVFHWSDGSTLTLDPRWRDDPEVQAYCAARGYVLTATPRKGR